MTKFEKKTSVCKWEKHLPFDVKNFLEVRGNSIETALQTYGTASPKQMNLKMA